MHIIKRIAAAFFRITLSVAALAIILAASTYFYTVYTSHAEQRKEEARIQELQDRLDALPSPQSWEVGTAYGTASVKLKFGGEDQVDFQLEFTCEDDVELVKIHYFEIAFLDLDGFLVHEERIAALTRRIAKDANGKARGVGAYARGNMRLNADDYLEITNVSVSHASDVRKIQSTEGAKKSISRSSKSTKESEFKSEMEKWRAKASRIVVGMTHGEMVQAAGQPRMRASISTSEDLSQGYDYFKYNYGPAWVYFKDALVHKIVDATD